MTENSSDDCTWCDGSGKKRVPVSGVVTRGGVRLLQWTYRTVDCAICFVRKLGERLET